MSDFPIVIAAAASPEVPMNENLNAIAWTGVYARDPRTSSALTWAYFGSASPSGTVLWGGVTVTAGTFTLTDNTDNYIVVNRSTGATTCGTATTNWTDTANYARVYKVTTVSSAVTVIEDHRAGPFGAYGQSASSAGTVTSVAASNGVRTASGSALTTSGTIYGDSATNAQTGTTYTVLTGDRGKLVTHANASAIAVTLPQAGASFPDGWYYDTKATGAGTTTITPTTSTINGTTTLALTSGQSARIVSDGTNYTALLGSSVGGGSGDALVANPLSQFAATTSAQLAGVISDETGSGALVFATSPTLVTPVLGTPSSGNLSSCTADGTNAVGFRHIPQNSNSAAYTTVLADAGKHIFHPAADTTARTFTIDSNANVAYAVGTAITFINQNAAGVVTIAITSDTMRLAGAGTTGSRTLAANGIATAVKIATTEWIISGTGLT